MTVQKVEEGQDAPVPPDGATPPGGALKKTSPVDPVLAEAERAFDREFYLATYPDVRKAEVDPFNHYMTHGWKERGRDPCSDFCTAVYLDRHPDVATSGENPFLHWLRAGRPDQSGDRHLATLMPELDADAARRVREAFNDDFYLASNPDIRKNGLDPFQHYMVHGWKERRRDPRPDFSTAHYLGEHADIARAGVNPFVHYVLHGRAEGRSTMPTERGTSAAERSGVPAAGPWEAKGSPASKPDGDGSLATRQRLRMLVRDREVMVRGGTADLLVSVLGYENALAAKHIRAAEKRLRSVREDRERLGRQRKVMEHLLAAAAPDATIEAIFKTDIGGRAGAAP